MPTTASDSGPRKALQRLGLERDIDLALHLPLRWEDETRITRLADAREGQPVVLEGVVTACELQTRARRQLVATLDDGSGQCVLRFLHFYPSQQRALAPGRRVRARGELRGGLLGWQMVHPSVTSADAPLPEALTPVYPSTAGLPQTWLRRAIGQALDRAPLHDTVPAQFWGQIGLKPLLSLRETLLFLHRPKPSDAAALADAQHPVWQRLRAEELLGLVLSRRMARAAHAQLRAPPLPMRTLGLRDGLLAALPFVLTGAQQRAVAEIAADLHRPVPMNRLLQGDVGSGKTVVAALAAAQAIDAGAQCALMVPTEILAGQHLRKLVDWLAPLLAAQGRSVAWLAGRQGKAERARTLEAVQSGQAALVVGTHAVIQSQVQFAHLALAVVDEQHRFGVAQRLALRDKAPAGLQPHLLMMSATPIPRTLAMSHYADLDLSTLDERPPGRQPVVTKLVSAQRRTEVVARIRDLLAQGRQVYWVCPLIEPGEGEPGDAAAPTRRRPADDRAALADATATAAALADALGPDRVGLLHARLRAADKQAVMQRFVDGSLPVLVCTTVIEVGVDVPNATLMVIEHAERFGLSQLHQLRGRVGRGALAAACVLLYGDDSPLGPSARERLKAMLQTQDGFEIARRDLAIRGPGEFLGARQSGMPLLRFADLTRDADVLHRVHVVADALLAAHPEAARAHVERWFGGRSEFLRA